MASIPPTACSFGTGTVRLQPAIQVSPNTIFNAARATRSSSKESVIKPQLYVDNVFDKSYLLKGAFFSGPSVGRPRSFQLKLKATF